MGGSSTEETQEPTRAETATPQPVAEPTTTTSRGISATPRATAPSAARTNVPADASSIVTAQRPTSSHRRKKQHRVAKANIKYNNEAGRAAILAVCQTLHHDLGQLNNIVNVTVPADELEILAENPDVAWIDRSGAVFFMQPFRSSQ